MLSQGKISTNMDQPTENTTPSLNLSDIRMSVEIIALCAQRGAFKAEELSTVGTVYDRLTAFLAAGEQSQAAENPVPDTDTKE